MCLTEWIPYSQVQKTAMEHGCVTYMGQVCALQGMDARASHILHRPPDCIIQLIAIDVFVSPVADSHRHYQWVRDRYDKPGRRAVCLSNSGTAFNNAMLADLAVGQTCQGKICPGPRGKLRRADEISPRDCSDEANLTERLIWWGWRSSLW